MNDKIEKKYLEDKRRNYYGGAKNDALYLFRQSLLNSCFWDHPRECTISKAS
jgi:hypothetical protein